MSQALGNSISIIVPCHNATQTLEQSLLSIRAAIAHALDLAVVSEAELILIDDDSSDTSATIGTKHSDKLIRHDTRLGANACRNSGIEASKNSLLIFIDADIVVEKEHLSLVANYFDQHQNIDALTGMLSAHSHLPGFFTDYKNLYMNYIFSKQSEDINFLYGSIFALRREVALEFKSMEPLPVRRPAEDTRLGLKLSNANRKIHLLKKLEVYHLKKYSFFSLIENDFRIPYRWSNLFFAESGWKQFGKKGSGFAHASKKQILSLLIAPLIIILSILNITTVILPASVFTFWLLLNIEFFLFIKKKRGLGYCLAAVIFTLLDHLVMLAGVISGFLKAISSNSSVKD